MTEYATPQTMEDLLTDADAFARFINGADNLTVTPREGAVYYTLRGYVKTLIGNGMIPATPYQTKPAMQSALGAAADLSYAVVTDDPTLDSDGIPSLNGFYQKRSGAWVFLKWNPLSMWRGGLASLRTEVLAYADAKKAEAIAVAAADASAKATAAQVAAVNSAAADATNKANAAQTAAIAAAASDATNKDTTNLTAAKAYADVKKTEAFTASAADSTAKANAAQAAAIAAAATDATSKANAAQAAAIAASATDASTKATAAQVAAVASAAADATNKANAAQSAATAAAASDATNKDTALLVTAKAYSDTKKTEAIAAAALDATSKADAAQSAAIAAAGADATTKAANAQAAAVAAAATDASTKATAAQVAAVTAAAADATNKANAAQAAAVAAAAADATNKDAALVAGVNSYADTKKAEAIAAAALDATAKANTAQSNAISAAATDASTKATAAQVAATAAASTDATAKANTAKADAITVAATDATTKANAAQAAAISAGAADATAKANAAIATAAVDATTKADTAQSNAAADATAKANTAQSNAATDASTKVAAEAALRTTGDLAERAELDSRVPSLPAVAGDAVPIAVDAAGRVLLWLDKGVLDALGFGPMLTAILQANTVQAEGKSVPLIVDVMQRVFMWLADGKVDMNDLGPIVRNAIGLLSLNSAPASQALLSDVDGRVIMWLEKGLLDALGFGPNLLASLGVGSLDAVNSAIPLVLSNDRVYLWLENGRIDTNDIGPNLRKAVGTSLLDITASFVPLVADNAQRIWLALENGALESYGGVGENLRTSVGIGNLATLPTGIPLAIDDSNRVFAWLHKGLLDAVGFGPNLQAILDFNAENITGAKLPIYTDTTSLRRWKGNGAKARAGLGQCRIGVTGDSWTETIRLSPAFKAALVAEYGTAGFGWLSASGGFVDPAVTRSLSGQWGTTYNSITQPAAAPTVGCGPDGYAFTTTLVGSTLSINGIPNSDTVTVFFGRTAGEFRYREAGGVWTNVVINGSGAAVQSVTFPLNGQTSFTLELVAGNFTLLGALARNTTGSGVEYSKIGHAGASGADYVNHTATWTPYFTSALNFDLVVVLLGTNDSWQTYSSVATHVQGLRDIVAAYRTGNPTCGFIFVAPAMNNGTQRTPQYLLRDAMFSVAHELGAEFYNMYDDWDTYAVENANGQWADPYHVSNSIGTGRTVRALFDHFLKA